MSNKAPDFNESETRLPRGSFVPLGESGDGPDRSAAPDGADGFSTEAPPKKKVSTQTFIIALVLVGGGGALYWMRQNATRSGIVFGDITQLEYNPQTQPVDEARHQVVIGALEHSSEPVQVPEGAIQKNPFVLAQGEDTGAGPVIPASTNDDSEIMRRLVQKVQLAIEGMQIHSVMDGSTPLAKINGQLVRIGDRVGEHCTVKDIRGRWVYLHAQEIGRTWKLAAGEPPTEVDPGQW